MSRSEVTTGSGRLRELVLIFLRLGTVAFGGPAAHVAMMRAELVEKRGWLTDERFLDLYAATNLIPGPNSTELAMHIGRERAGWPGLLVAGSCFIVPAALITSGFAYIYTRYGALPALDDVFYGVKPTVLAIVAAAIVKLARPTLKRLAHFLVGAALLACALSGRVHELVVLALGALAGLLWMRRRVEPPKPAAPEHLRDGVETTTKLPSLVWAPALLGTPAVAPTAAKLGLVFLKIGSILFGSGYILLAFLERDFVDTGWLTQQQLLDLVAIGQFTPGPVFTTATAIGWFLGGPSGAAAATIGIFFPAFVLVALTHGLLGRLRASPTLSGLLDGVNVASLVLMAAVMVSLGRGALVSWPAIVIAVVATIAALRTKWNPTWFLVGGALVGLAARGLHLA
ncbi:MAG: chromate efflux transporter [Polyangiales bacterium]